MDRGVEKFGVLRETRLARNGRPPVLVSVTITAPLPLPTVWEPKVRLVLSIVTPGDPTAPTPNRLIRCGLPGALSVMVMLPVRKPVARAVKVKLTTQDAPAAREVPQVLDCEKSPAA